MIHNQLIAANGAADAGDVASRLLRERMKPEACRFPIPAATRPSDAIDVLFTLRRRYRLGKIALSGEEHRRRYFIGYRRYDE